MTELRCDMQIADRLFALAQHFSNNTADRECIESFSKTVAQAGPMEIVEVVDRIVTRSGITAESKTVVDKLIRTVSRTISATDFAPSEGAHFLTLLMRENRHIEAVVKDLKKHLKTVNRSPVDVDRMQNALQSLERLLGEIKTFEVHYVKKENILFPYLEDMLPNPGCLKLMWAYHDDTRAFVRKALVAVREHMEVSSEETLKDLNQTVGRTLFSLFPTITKEDHILFPLAQEALSHKAFEQMGEQAKEIGYFGFVAPGARATPKKEAPFLTGELELNTGNLQLEQVDLLLRHLPLDITFVDETDRVRYFSQGVERFFPRTEAVIGREVQKCHPPSSVHLVEEILQGFRDGREDTAQFWIDYQGMKLNIRYVAVKDAGGNYRGCLETVQNVTHIQKMEGERRLVDWGK